MRSVPLQHEEDTAQAGRPQSRRKYITLTCPTFLVHLNAGGTAENERLSELPQKVETGSGVEVAQPGYTGRKTEQPARPESELGLIMRVYQP